MNENTITMTREQLNALKAEIKAEVVQEVSCRKQNREPYITHQIHKKYEQQLFEKFGEVWFHDAWVAIKRIALYKNHIRRINQLNAENSEAVGRDIEALLQFILLNEELPK